MNPVRLFATDLDGTLIGNPAATKLFTDTWNALDDSQRPLLVYNSGRLADDISELVTSGSIPVPDYIIGGVGTEIVDIQADRQLKAYQELIAQDWDRNHIEEALGRIPGIAHQPERFQNRFKSSWYLHDADEGLLHSINCALKERNIRAAVVYSSNRDLDILPIRADKGHALSWLLEHIGVASDEVLVAGDRGNDRGMFEIDGVRGILVENAQPELFETCAKCSGEVFHSERLMAEGLLDGLAHFGVIEDMPDITPVAVSTQDEEMSLLFSDAVQRHLSSDQLDLVATGYDRALDAIRKNFTPIGFSACSLDDNDVVGTDANYRSVWGRDGAITLISTLCVGDPEIIDQGRRTLETLLDFTTENGQAPANVHIADRRPDYSGVGGICAIDSAIWVVIALYHYVKTTGDLDFLQRYRHKLDSLIHWLQSHDSNLDGLLEVPEASDWTDLFGRSYNVLYDEVLWYRAMVCYAHMLELLGKHEESAKRMHQSQQIRGKILRAFWPTTNHQDEAIENTFADRQYSLGDARFLLAEVSPFNFSWRCDVLGNILGFLTNVLDVPKARTALSFMWGVGVNDPWPVANLYPVVQAGDPDWKPYYTVNLLNLPHHYHNGGIWPFVGGMWVRFIYRLGQHQVACQELVRLAECNRQGRHVEWEFNEWCHGQTGRPMGKAYQAWSAATYLRACHEVGLHEIIKQRRG